MHKNITLQWTINHDLVFYVYVIMRLVIQSSDKFTAIPEVTQCYFIVFY